VAAAARDSAAVFQWRDAAEAQCLARHGDIDGGAPAVAAASSKPLLPIWTWAGPQGWAYESGQVRWWLAAPVGWHCGGVGSRLGSNRMDPRLAPFGGHGGRWAVVGALTCSVVMVACLSAAVWPCSTSFPLDSGEHRRMT
jgi:hypothetical protein